MNTNLKIEKVITVIGLALFFSCTSGARKNQSFNNEINSEFKHIECADYKARFKTTTLNCYLDLTTKYKKGNIEHESRTLHQRTVASKSTPQRP